MSFLVVFAGAGVGAVLRYLFTKYANFFKIDYKIGATFAINIVGSFILGMALKNFSANSLMYLLIGTGFCGGLTTFSTFNSELMGLVYDKKYAVFGIYLIASYIVGILAGIIGFYA